MNVNRTALVLLIGLASFFSACGSGEQYEARTYDTVAGEDATTLEDEDGTNLEDEVDTTLEDEDETAVDEEEAARLALESYVGGFYSECSRTFSYCDGIADEFGEDADLVELTPNDAEDLGIADASMFVDKFSDEFANGCNAVFDQYSPDGYLYSNDIAYSSDDCPSPELPASKSEAEDAEHLGCQALFGSILGFSLNYGERSVTESDCPV